MKIILFGIPNCNTVKKTIDWFNTKEISFEFHNFKKDGITKSRLKDWTNQTQWENLVNKKSATWRNLDQSEKDNLKNANTAIELLSIYPTLIKRPVITQDGKIKSIGFDEAILNQIFLAP
ncbi:MAG TPA: Spx/MgsR family RNA polymerase-binding regulatory protein [Edaphocola sp.]|nr:Spx/MgsR family RNA polymerase-binding regulatory protein [Edaphocola sp.]